MISVLLLHNTARYTVNLDWRKMTTVVQKWVPTSRDLAASSLSFGISAGTVHVGSRINFTSQHGWRDGLRSAEQHWVTPAAREELRW